MTFQVLQEKVDCGVALLNERVPDWRNHVNSDVMRMNGSSHNPNTQSNGCVLAQLNYARILGDREYGHGSYYDAMEALFPEDSLDENVSKSDLAEQHGFLLTVNSDENDSWEDLTELWKVAIRSE